MDFDLPAPWLLHQQPFIQGPEATGSTDFSKTKATVAPQQSPTTFSWGHSEERGSPAAPFVQVNLGAMLCSQWPREPPGNTELGKTKSPTFLVGWTLL